MSENTLPTHFFPVPFRITCHFDESVVSDEDRTFFWFIMEDDDDDEMRVPAEEHQMDRQPELEEGVTFRLPPFEFLQHCDNDKEVATELALMAGFKLTLGPRARLDVYPVIPTKSLDAMVASSPDCNALMETFQSQFKHTCKEIVVIVQGPSSTISVTDVSNRGSIPIRISQRSLLSNSSSFTTGHPIEVCKTFAVDSKFPAPVKKYFPAKCTSFIIRCRFPLSTPKNGEYSIFKSSSLACTHLGATGSGLTVRHPATSRLSRIGARHHFRMFSQVLHNYGKCPDNDHPGGWNVSLPAPWAMQNDDNLEGWRRVVKKNNNTFSTRFYVEQADETTIADCFEKNLSCTDDDDPHNRQPTDIIVDLTQSFFDYTDLSPFWETERKIPFLVWSDFSGMCEKMVSSGDVIKLDLINGVQQVVTRFTNESESWNKYRSDLVLLLEADAKGSTSKSARGGESGRKTRFEPWTDEWLKTCSNKSLGNALKAIIATFKFVDNEMADRKEDWRKILLVVGRKSTLAWTNTTCADGWDGDNSDQRKKWGLSVLVGTATKAVAEAMVLTAITTHGDNFPAQYTPDELRAQWKAMHGELSALENVWILVDPTYKKVEPEPAKPDKPNKPPKRARAGELRIDVLSPSPIPEASHQLGESTTVAPPVGSITDQIERMQLGPCTSDVHAVCEYMVEEGHVQQGYESEVAHILQAYGEIMVRKSAQSSSAVSKNHAVASSRADLVEDALVDVIFQLKGTLDVKSKDDVTLFQFLANKLTARGNPAAYNADDWKALKERLMKPAFF